MKIQEIEHFLTSKIGKLFIEKEDVKLSDKQNIVLFLQWNYKRIYSGDDGIEIHLFSLTENKLVKQTTTKDIMGFEFYFYYTELI